MKKLLGVMLLTIAVVLMFSGIAFANFGPHGGYANDTDACAGCHRAHTSFSSVTWTDNTAQQNSHSALLVSNATNMSDFCYACHGDGAPGAATNVMSGVFDSGPSVGSLGATSASQPYQTNSTFGGALNGGGFVRLPISTGFDLSTSSHNMDSGYGTIVQWGAGSSQKTVTNLTCTDCHDPHGSSNYRLLKDTVNSVAVGGYNGDVPTPFVWSAETGYPRPDGTTNGGWLKHVAGQTQMADYKPDYTSPEYQWVDVTNGGGPLKNMAMWCSACHTDYGDPTKDGAGTVAGSSANYGAFEASGTIQVGDRPRHRHPTNITLAAGVGGVGVRALAEEVQTSAVLPLDRNSAETNADPWSTSDYIDCLTCHRAHGVDTTMTGWASASLDTTTSSSAVVTWFPKLDPAKNGGVNPDYGQNPANGGLGTSDLLRANNRGVCELCHNK